MSRSLSRIRSLVSEIEEIHRQGQQQGGQAAGKTAHPFSQSTATAIPLAEAAPVAALAPAPVATSDLLSSVERVEISPAQKVSPPPLIKTVDKTVDATEADPFLEIAHMVNLDESKTPPRSPVPTSTGKISMQLSGAVALSLQIQNTGETIEVKQVGNMLEIRFADGKAFHLPLKLVA